MVPFSLDFDRRQRLAGERIDGHVELDVLGLTKAKVEDVRLELKGALYVVPARTNSTTSPTVGDTARPVQSVNTKVKPTVDLLSEGMTVWHQGLGQPDVLRVPFSFVLPRDLPPSCEVVCSHWAGSVVYALLITARRSGMHKNEVLEEHIAVVPGSRKGAALHATLSAGPWEGEWKTVRAEKDIRRGLWGEYSHVAAALTLPAVSVFPTDTDIPFALRITTTSRAMDEADAHAAHVFPAPPSRFPDLDFRLERSARCAKERAALSCDLLDRFDCFRPGNSTVAERKEWRPLSQSGPEDAGKGRWRQEATFTSAFRLECAPSFHLEEMELAYGLHLKIAFPGIGNNIVLEYPIEVVAPRALPPRTESPPVPPKD
ncbi:arrestin-N domain-containing protein [Phanerochaete sordida]|uniref:Arrestin-N domain-containing protein n=1 Tax=Phanerochaete sordida TaxID=48140 RepID=A0A9P3L7I3_9APHY|nr:arrestin-N domain-containing protein [Phanerochaete sordida]